ncbi:MAG: hypothetical protein ACREM1_12265 [Longimicrobiales bacterium]
MAAQSPTAVTDAIEFQASFHPQLPLYLAQPLRVFGIQTRSILRRRMGEPTLVRFVGLQ